MFKKHLAYEDSVLLIQRIYMTLQADNAIERKENTAKNTILGICTRNVPPTILITLTFINFAQKLLAEIVYEVF